MPSFYVRLTVLLYVVGDDTSTIPSRVWELRIGNRDAQKPGETGLCMLAVLGGLADVERDLIRTRTAEGRNRAKAQGKAMGRPPSLTPAQQKEAIRRRAQGETLAELARSYNVSRATISRLTA